MIGRRVVENSDRIYRLRNSDVKTASVVLGRAFDKDPDVVTIIPPERYNRQEKIFSIFRCFVRFGLLSGEVYAPSSQIEGVSIWFLSSKMSINFFKALRAGFLSLFKTLDGNEIQQFRTCGQEIENYHRDLISEEHWYLNIIGVDPTFQRQGYAKKIFGAMLSRIDEERLPCFLDTNSEKNVSIYEKFGFKVAQHYTVLQHNTHWGMLRQPQ
jgi:ribosomal protein S18 acetylase RimI-like enzyme